MNSELNVLGLILGASLPVKLVLGILIAFSIASWFIIFRKKALLDRANRGADEFEERFDGFRLAVDFGKGGQGGVHVGARHRDRILHQLGLAAGEVVVDRAARRATLRQDVGERRA